MIFNQLIIDNFGLYEGVHKINLRPHNSKKPVIIFGGKNGAGKTTLMEAVKLCLYGPLFTDGRTMLSQVDYEQYLRTRLHRGSLLVGATHASVELSFEHAVAGVRQTYTVRRSWQVNGHQVREQLLVYEDSNLLQEIDAQHWQDFLTGLIAPGLSQLFFFDAEKIAALTHPQTHDLALARSIKTLLGVDLVEQLQADLNIYRRRLVRDQQHYDQLETEILQATNAIQQHQATLNQLNQEQQRLEHEIEMTVAKIVRQEQDIAQLGGGFAQKREENQTSQIQVEVKIEQVETEIRELCSGLFPFAMTPKYTNLIREQLNQEARYQKWMASKLFLEQLLPELQQDLASPEFWQDDTDVNLSALAPHIAKRVKVALEKRLLPSELIQNFKPFLHLSEPKQHQLSRWIEASQTTIPNQMKQLAEELSQLKAQQRLLEKALLRVPEDDVLAPLVKDLQLSNQQLGALNEQLRQVTDQIRRVSFQRDEVNRQLSRLENKQTQYQQHETNAQQVTKIQQVLRLFGQRLIQDRIERLEVAFTLNFNRLSRKEQLINHIKIDPQTFAVTLIDQHQQPIAQHDLSAGEQQIYAIAMLWALRQVSGRPLPIMIDTPLSRLDSDHRQNFIERYLPHASHQVILFSTDTEVGATFYEAIRPLISQAYHLDFDEAARKTNISKGYFWNSSSGQQNEPLTN